MAGRAHACSVMPRISRSACARWRTRCRRPAIAGSRGATAPTPRCRRASRGSACAPPMPITPRGRVAAHRMAPRGKRAHALFSLDPAGHPLVQGLGRRGQDALADRTRLPGTQAGSGARALRRTQLARISSSCQSVHCGVRVSDARAAGRREKKLRSTQNASRTRRLPPARGWPRCNATSRGRSPPRGFGWDAPSPARWRSARVAVNPTDEDLDITNTVQLGVMNK